MDKQLNGYIKVYRSLLDWRWYSDPIVSRVFLHLLLKATYKDASWQYENLEAGQLITSSDSIAKELNLSRQQVRTALNKLNSTNEITSKSTNKYTVITVNNWANFQDLNETSTNKATNKLTINQPSINQQSTTSKESKEYKEGKEINNNISSEQDEPAREPVIKLLLSNSTYYPIYEEDVAMWQDGYPAVDVKAELKKMNLWFDANPKKRKTAKGIRACINSWLSRCQDKGSSSGYNSTSTKEQSETYLPELFNKWSV